MLGVSSEQRPAVNVGAAAFVALGQRVLRRARVAAGRSASVAPIVPRRAPAPRFDIVSGILPFVSGAHSPVAAPAALAAAVPPHARSPRHLGFPAVPNILRARPVAGERPTTHVATKLRAEMPVAQPLRAAAPQGGLAIIAVPWVVAPIQPAGGTVAAPAPRQLQAQRSSLAPIAAQLAIPARVTQSIALPAAPMPRIDATGRTPELPDASLRIDGLTFSRWLGDELAQAALRPPSGISAMDDRLTPVFPGAPIG